MRKDISVVWVVEEKYVWLQIYQKIRIHRLGIVTGIIVMAKGKEVTGVIKGQLDANNAVEQSARDDYLSNKNTFY